MARSESACSLGITEQADSYKSRSEFPCYPPRPLRPRFRERDGTSTTRQPELDRCRVGCCVGATNYPGRHIRTERVDDYLPPDRGEEPHEHAPRERHLLTGIHDHRKHFGNPWINAAGAVTTTFTYRRVE